jgi:hypothetical protein
MGICQSQTQFHIQNLCNGQKATQEDLQVRFSLQQVPIQFLFPYL